jgi:hypothetical protein
MLENGGAWVSFLDQHTDRAGHNSRAYDWWRHHGQLCAYFYILDGVRQATRYPSTSMCSGRRTIGAFSRVNLKVSSNTTIQ